MGSTVTRDEAFLVAGELVAAGFSVTLNGGPSGNYNAPAGELWSVQFSQHGAVKRDKLMEAFAIVLGHGLEVYFDPLGRGFWLQSKKG